MFTILFFCILTSLAAPPDLTVAPKERPLVPTTTTTLIDDAASIWLNPANLGFRRGSASTLLFRGYQNTEYDLSYAQKTGNLGLGVRYHQFENGGWWSTAGGLSFKLSDTMRLGTNLTWQVPNGDAENFFGWDLAATWRIAPWLGLSGVIHNIGSEGDVDNDILTIAKEERRLGGAFRLLNGALQIGADYIQIPSEEWTARGVIQAQLMNGLSLQVEGDREQNFGFGLTLNLQESFYGFSTISSPERDRFNYTLSISRDQNRKVVSPLRNGVAVFNLDTQYPYTSSRSLFVAATEEYVSLLERLHKASQDKSIKGVVVKLNSSPFSFAQAQEIRHLLEQAKANNKQVTVYLGSSVSNLNYYIASVANRIYLHPSAEVGLIGLRTERYYLRGILNWFGLEPEFIKRSTYKSAPEQFTNHQSSEASQQQTNELLNDMYHEFCTDLSKSRGVSRTEIEKMIDNGPYTARSAKSKNLVDDLRYPDQLEETIKEIYGERSHIVTKYASNDYSAGWGNNAEIAVIYITGMIATGSSSSPGLLGGSTITGSKTIVAQLDKAAESSSIKAVVLRVDSPGGSAFASEEIWRAIEKYKESQKPIIVSMGGTAASGGYYVSAGADAIYAEPTTVTGSIGVYGGKFNTQKLLERLSIQTEVYTRGRNAALYTTTRPWDPNEKAKMEEMIEETYRIFKERVKTGRKLDAEKVESLAQGRVWSGKAAKTHGLVDVLGGFFQAIERAKTEARIPTNRNIDIVTFSTNNRTNVPLGSLLLGEKLKNPNLVESLLKEYQQLSNEHIWMMSPQHLEIK